MANIEIKQNCSNLPLKPFQSSHTMPAHYQITSFSGEHSFEKKNWHNTRYQNNNNDITKYGQKEMLVSADFKIKNGGAADDDTVGTKTIIKSQTGHHFCFL